MIDQWEDIITYGSIFELLYNFFGVRWFLLRPRTLIVSITQRGEKGWQKRYIVLHKEMRSIWYIVQWFKGQYGRQGQIYEKADTSFWKLWRANVKEELGETYFSFTWGDFRCIAASKLEGTHGS